MKRKIGITTLVAALALLLPGCKRSEREKPAKPDAGAAAQPEAGAAAKPEAGAASKPAHVQADGSVQAAGSVQADHEGDHAEVAGRHETREPIFLFESGYSTALLIDRDKEWRVRPSLHC